jgi:hypothetical protein
MNQHFTARSTVINIYSKVAFGGNQIQLNELGAVIRIALAFQRS